jgi:hypothetical protein
VALTVLIANHNTSKFLEVSLKALGLLTESPLTVLVHDGGSRPDDVDGLRVVARSHPNVHLHERSTGLVGSYAHGDAMNFLMEQVETPYAAIVDADCMPLVRGWDTYLITRLDERTKIVGSSVGEGWRGNRPIDFPMPFLALFETATYRQLGINALPGSDTRVQDTCWEWRPKYLDAGYRGECLRSENMRLNPAGAFEHVHCAVYYTHDGRLLGSHFGRGSNPTAKLLSRRTRVASLVDRIAGRDRALDHWVEQRDRWLAKCEEIIQSEAAREPERA